LPFLYVPEREKVSPLETSDVEFGCALLYGNEDNMNNITWKWMYNGLYFLQETDRIEITNTQTPFIATRLNFREVKMIEKGYYECQAYNQYGMASQKILLNVKSMKVYFFFNISSN
jgi:hypothetical protein